MKTAPAAVVTPGDAGSPTLEVLSSSAPVEAIRTFLVTLVLSVAALLAWTMLAELDIVATAPGKLVPVSQVKAVQSADAGVVVELRVSEGDRVRAGDLLLRLDATFARADAAQLEGEIGLKRLTVLAIDAALAGTPLADPAGAPRPLFNQVRAQFEARRQALDDAVAQEQEAAVRARHERTAAQRQLDKLTQTLPTYRQAAESYAQLQKEGFVGQLAASEKERDAVEREQDLKAQAATIEALTAAIAQSERRQQQLWSNYAADLLRERGEARAALLRLQQDAAKNEFRSRLLDLVAPQDGRVKDLLVRAPGYVVQAGTVLMRIVPDGDPLVAEAMLANEDVGFVEVGQPARIKLMAYPFQKYGLLDARVAQISADAADDTDRANASRAPLAYRAVLQLSAQRLIAPGGDDFELTAGMAATVEIHQGRRTVMEFLTSPVRRVVAEAGRER
jgi:HlyD family secretion protein